MKGVQGKVAIVTGSSAGIGKGIAEVFAREGAKVVVNSRTEAAGHRVVDGIRQTGGEAIYAGADVSQPGGAQALIAAAQEAFGTVDIMVHNAGSFGEIMLDDMTIDDWDRVHHLNLRGLFLLTQAVLPTMKAQQSGRILVTSSITGPRTGMPGFTHYGATKGGVNGFIRSAAVELAPWHITVNGVEPGNVLTEGLAELGEEYLTRMTKSIPLGRLGSPQDIGYAMMFLASEEAGWITGETLVVDGGQIVPESLS